VQLSKQDGAAHTQTSMLLKFAALGSTMRTSPAIFAVELSVVSDASRVRREAETRLHYGTLAPRTSAARG
jgi:hypothetical protein